jgi:predicted nucleic acid-binding protein
VAFDDAERYLPQILNKYDRAHEVEGALAYLGQMRVAVLPVAADIYQDRMADALSRIGSRDPDDWPVLATALAIDCPIWTEDQDFFGVGVPTWTTDRIEIYLAANGA